MTNDREALEQIIRGFDKEPLDLDVFILKLLDTKAWHKADRESTVKAERAGLKVLTPKAAQKAVSDLCNHLEDAAKLFRQLNAGTMPMAQPLSANIVSSAEAIGFSRIEGEISLSVAHRNVATDLAPAILEWLKAETDKAAEALVREQKTIKSVKEFDLYMLAEWCVAAGITISYRDGAPFEKLSQWLLGEGSHRSTIEKIIKRYEHLRDTKKKNSEN